jgi:hypothetical protein
MHNVLSTTKAQAISVTHRKRKPLIHVLSVSTIFLILSMIIPISNASAHVSSNSPISTYGTNPYSPAYQHNYRHGAVPTTIQLDKIKSYQKVHHDTAVSNILSYGGGINGVGVTSGKEKVYLVFWGTQWGTPSTDSNGNLTLSNDSAGVAPYVQNLFKGLGTGNELWSGTMTQYCDGPGVSSGATTCSSTDMHVGYPTGGTLAGVLYDNSGPEPDAATHDQLASEADNAAAFLGNTTAASNRYAQYVILSPTGTNPDNFNAGVFCAWHNYSSSGNVAFTNLPYLLDTYCGQNFVNAGSNGTLDAYSIVEGHEYAETITDQNPGGGWWNRSNGDETGDECAWISPGQQGGAGNVITGSGTFAMQSTWSNDTNSCALSHPIFGETAPNDFSISPGSSILSIAPGSSSTSKIGTAVTSGSSATVSLSVGVSPSGPTASLSPTSMTVGNSSMLTINVGSSVAAGTYTVTVKGTEGSVIHSTSVTVTVTSTSRSGITNGGFETGSLSGWNTTGTTSISSIAHSGRYSSKVGASSATNGDSSIGQTFTVPARTGTLSFWYRMSCPDVVKYDWATATLKDNTSGKTITVLTKTCHTSASWTRVAAQVIAGHAYTLNLVSHDDNIARDPTYTLFDDIVLSL